MEKIKESYKAEKARIASESASRVEQYRGKARKLYYSSVVQVSSPPPLLCVALRSAKMLLLLLLLRVPRAQVG